VSGSRPSPLKSSPRSAKPCLPRATRTDHQRRQDRAQRGSTLHDRDFPAGVLVGKRQALPNRPSVPAEVGRWPPGVRTPLDGASRGGTAQPVACALIRRNVIRQHDTSLGNTIAHGLVMRRSRVRIQLPATPAWDSQALVGPLRTRDFPGTFQGLSALSRGLSRDFSLSKRERP
jgi:hypothetical protein